MAATKLIAMHQNKGRSVMQCLKDRTDYAMNGDKTEDGKYISSYQCNPELVDLEFAQAKKEYLHKTWRQPKGDVLAYQIRQSFKPGEITPEEANEVGYETGMRFTKGKHAFIVATHVDRAHIHNHIIFNSTNLDCDRKFRDFWFSGIALQRLSDIICLEHGLSIIPKVKPSERQRRTKYPERISMRDVIREDILRCLEQKPEDFEVLLKLLQQEGYEIKRGKHTAICGNEQKRFIRFRSLGEDYTEENLKKIPGMDGQGWSKLYSGSAVSESPPGASRFYVIKGTGCEAEMRLGREVFRKGRFEDGRRLLHVAVCSVCWNILVKDHGTFFSVLPHRERSKGEASAPSW